MTALPRVVRAERWWNGKLAPIVGVGATAIASGPTPPASSLGRFALFVLSAVGIATFGHVVNDLADRDVDALAGKPNPMSRLALPTRTMLLVLSAVLGLLPWLFLPRRAASMVLLVVEVVLLVAYSVPPIRLKVRGAAGVVADAGYAYVVPIVWAAVVFAAEGVPAPFLVLLGTWATAVGLRSILWHQLDDAHADAVAGSGTVVVRRGRPAVERFVAGVLLPVEVIAGAALVALVAASGESWLAVLFVGFVLWRLFQVRYFWDEPLLPKAATEARPRVRLIGFVIGNDFLERWLPLAACLVVALRQPVWWIAVAVVLVGFNHGVRDFVVDDVWGVPDAVERMAIDLWSLVAIRRAGREYRRRIAAGPAPVTTPAVRDRRWVFVVCGPEEHLTTFSVAAARLRPLTALEIWVVTDSGRNGRPLDHSHVDRVVDIATPAGLDDHQASIWLKTGLGGLLPEGEWCYLDTDVIAVAPAAEAVFESVTGPVTFASDLTGGFQSVDYFSPYAMTCGCAEFTDHCGHLADQLRVRFGLDVPGDWLHWNGGVFVFGPDGREFLRRWHETAVASFDWPEWRTRDQGALIATVWAAGLQDHPRLAAEFNFIADFRHPGLEFAPGHGWRQNPEDPWVDARLLHLYTSELDAPGWTLESELRAAILQGRSHRYRYRRDRYRAWARSVTVEAPRIVYWKVISPIFWKGLSPIWWRLLKPAYWRGREFVELSVLRLKKVPSRIARRRQGGSR